jgi:hypothetical protein
VFGNWGVRRQSLRSFVTDKNKQKIRRSEDQKAKRSYPHGRRVGNSCHVVLPFIENVRKSGGVSPIPDFEPLTNQIIACAIEVHKTLGPGLLESFTRNAYLKLTGCPAGLLLISTTRHLRVG